MRVEVLYFAGVADLTGRDREEADVPDDVRTVAAFRAWLEGVRPALAGRLGAVRVARNEVFARDDEPVADGDVLALIPPVAGG